MSAWSQVTRHDPCTICGHSDWCARSIDGAWALCRRVDDGTGIHRVDKAGAAYWLYKVQEHASPRPATPTPLKPQAERADPVTLDRLYGSLLAVLPLLATHRQALRARGLDEKAILRGRYRTLPLRGRADLARRLVHQCGEAVCSTVPGFYQAARHGRHWWSLACAPGLLVPVRDLAGHIVALKVRTDDPGTGKKYSTVSSAKYGGPGLGAQVHVPLHAAAAGGGVRITEGELKADVATVLSGTLWGPLHHHSPGRKGQYSDYRARGHGTGQVAPGEHRLPPGDGRRGPTTGDTDAGPEHPIPAAHEASADA